jgi:hypothetical protein
VRSFRLSAAHTVAAFGVPPSARGNAKQLSNPLSPVGTQEAYEDGPDDEPEDEPDDEPDEDDPDEEPEDEPDEEPDDEPPSFGVVVPGEGLDEHAQPSGQAAAARRKMW